MAVPVDVADGGGMDGKTAHALLPHLPPPVVETHDVTKAVRDHLG